MSGSVARTVYPGTPVGLAPTGRAVSLVPLAWPNANPGDALDYTVDFTQELAGGTDTVLASAAVAITPSGTMVAGAPVINGLAASFNLSGGAAGSDYVVEVTAGMASGRQVVAQVQIYVVPVL